MRNIYEFFFSASILPDKATFNVDNVRVCKILVINIYIIVYVNISSINRQYIFRVQIYSTQLLSMAWYSNVQMKEI
jgi:hypothetical protein